MQILTAIIFDLDGTIADNLSNIISGYKMALSEFGIKITNDEFIPNLGKSISEIETLYSINNGDREKFREAYIKNLSKLQNNIIQGMKEVLDYISQNTISTAIVTSKLTKTTHHLLNELDLNKYFDVVITSKDTLKAKPDPSPLLLACKKLGLKPSKLIAYVGDSISDMQAAKTAHLTPIGVTWGVAGNHICKDGIICIDKPAEIIELLNR